MKDIIKKKIQMLEKEIEAIEINIASLENKKVPTKILERREWLDKVEKSVVGGKDDLVVEYILD